MTVDTRDDYARVASLFEALYRGEPIEAEQVAWFRMSAPRHRAGPKMAERKKRLLIVPAAGSGNGMGHLTRCIRLSREVDVPVTFLTTRMDAAARSFLQRELLRVPARRRPAVISRPGSGAPWDLILVDARRTTRAELEAVAGHGQVVCLDEGGEARELRLFHRGRASRAPGTGPRRTSARPPFSTCLRARARGRPGPSARSLLSFGGEDEENLSGRLLAALTRERAFSLPGS